LGWSTLLPDTGCNGGKGMEKATQKKKLKLDPDFTPCPQEEDDELFPNGIFVFNITKLEEEIRRLPQRFRMEEVQVSRFPAEFSSLNEDHVDKVDPTKPIILAEIAPNHYNVIDGHHRLDKARRSGLETVRAYVLDAEQHLPFLVSRKGYEAYVGYWNDKLGPG
jgi:hypothetical protein